MLVKKPKITASEKKREVKKGKEKKRSKKMSILKPGSMNVWLLLYECDAH